MAKSRGIGRGGPRPNSGRSRKPSAAVVAQVNGAALSEGDQITRAARSGGRDEAIRVGLSLGWGEDEICALTGYKPIITKREPLVASDEPKTATELKEFCLGRLKQIAEHSQSDNACVAAIRELHSRMDVEAGIAGGGKLGKKQVAEKQAAAMVDDDDWGADISASLTPGHVLN